MESKIESGITVLEVIVASSILLAAAGMLSKYFVVTEKAAQEFSEKAKSRDRIMHVLQVIRKQASVRDLASPMIVTANSLSLTIPLQQDLTRNYTLLITSKCRAAPAGMTVDLSRVTRGLSCLEKIACTQGIPYIEWSYGGSSTLSSQQDPELSTFNTEIKKAFGSPGFALCFQETLDSLQVEGLQFNLKTEQGISTARVAVENLVLPLAKRNQIDLVP